MNFVWIRFSSWCAKFLTTYNKTSIFVMIFNEFPRLPQNVHIVRENLSKIASCYLRSPNASSKTSITPPAVSSCMQCNAPSPSICEMQTSLVVLFPCPCQANLRECSVKSIAKHKLASVIVLEIAFVTLCLRCSREISAIHWCINSTEEAELEKTKFKEYDKWLTDKQQVETFGCLAVSSSLSSITLAQSLSRFAIVDLVVIIVSVIMLIMLIIISVDTSYVRRSFSCLLSPSFSLKQRLHYMHTGNAQTHKWVHIIMQKHQNKCTAKC